MRLILLCVLSAWVGAVEVGPVPVLKVIDGDTIEVQLDGKPERVRLLYVDTPECSDNDHGKEMEEGKAAKEALTKYLEPARGVNLLGPHEEFKRDRNGHILASVAALLPEDDGRIEENDAASYLIACGYSVYWRKYGDAPDIHELLLDYHATAELHKFGAWATAPDWMRDKANERTAPRAAP